MEYMDRDVVSNLGLKICSGGAISKNIVSPLYLNPYSKQKWEKSLGIVPTLNQEREGWNHEEYQHLRRELEPVNKSMIITDCMKAKNSVKKPREGICSKNRWFKVK